MYTGYKLAMKSTSKSAIDVLGKTKIYHVVLTKNWVKMVADTSGRFMTVLTYDFYAIVKHACKMKTYLHSECFFRADTERNGLLFQHDTAIFSMIIKNDKTTRPVVPTYRLFCFVLAFLDDKQVNYEFQRLI